METLRNDFTATGYVLNESHDKILFIYHKKLQKWMPPGGHLDANELPHQAAIRETLEETGVKAKVLHSGIAFNVSNQTESQLPSPYCIFHQVIPATTKDVKHMHVDFAYLMEAPEQELRAALDEVDAVRWFTKQEVLASETFEAIKKICEQVLR